MKDGPLDMRMNQNIGEDASSWLNKLQNKRFQILSGNMEKKKKQKESPKQLLRPEIILKSEQQKSW